MLSSVLLIPLSIPNLVPSLVFFQVFPSRSRSLRQSYSWIPAPRSWSSWFNSFVASYLSERECYFPISFSPFSVYLSCLNLPLSLMWVENLRNHGYIWFAGISSLSLSCFPRMFHVSQSKDSLDDFFRPYTIVVTLHPLRFFVSLWPLLSLRFSIAPLSTFLFHLAFSCACTSWPCCDAISENSLVSIWDGMVLDRAECPEIRNLHFFTILMTHFAWFATPTCTFFPMHFPSRSARLSLDSSITSWLFIEFFRPML